MSLIGRIALAFLLATAQLPAAFALDNAPASVVQELVPFSSDEGLARLARSIFLRSPTSSSRSRTPLSVVPPQRPSYSMRFAVGAPTYRAIEAACVQRTFNTFRATAIRPSRASHRIT